MVRKIININEEKCNGCGACAAACHEGAIGMVDGKAKLLRDDYCDGLGDCLPACPTGAISFVNREAAAYDQAAVAEHMAKKSSVSACPGQMMRKLNTAKNISPLSSATAAVSRLCQWPCQIKLVPVNAPYFDGAELLIAADCTAFAYAGLHEDFMKGKITLVGCPKLDSVDYSLKLAEIFHTNHIKNITVLRMEVPCCGGLEMAVAKALASAGKKISTQVVTISIDGQILSVIEK